MDEGTRELVEDGTIEEDEAEDFEELDPELQELVESGEMDIAEARDLNS